MTKKIIILTGSELRHTFFRKYMALQKDIEVINSFCEGMEKSLETFTKKDSNNEMRSKHLESREQSEKDFFELFVQTSEDCSRPIFLPKGEINNLEYTNKIIAINPDILVAYGCSIIKEPLLTHFSGRFLNVHLGLSPYYKGSGTNYWPLVNGEPEYVGATFMHIDPGIDTGEIIHQIRAEIVFGDTPSSIGNRLIVNMAHTYTKIIKNINSLPKMVQLGQPKNERIVYKQKDYSEESVIQLYENFKYGLIEKYLSEKVNRCAKVPIVSNYGLKKQQ